MAKFDLDSYETVAERLARAHTDYPELRVVTNLVDVARNDNNLPIQYIVQAQIYIGDVLKAQDYAEEIVGNGPVNKTSALENCATSAIGRALADMGYQGGNPSKTRPSREEMEKVVRAEQTKVQPSAEQIQLVSEALDQINEIQNMEELKNLYQGATEAGIAYLNVNGINIYTAVTAAKKRIEANA